MSASILIYASLLAAAITFMFFKFGQYQTEQKLNQMLEDATEQLTKPAFRCVEINADSEACASARALINQRILTEDAPIFPLSGCNAKQCQCSYLKFDDRRSGIDRRAFAQDNKKHALVYDNKRDVQDRRKNSIKDMLLA